MNRRNLFKMLGMAVVSAVCAPLVKPVPEPRLRIGDTIRIRKPARYFIKQMDADLRAITGLYERSLGAEKDMREAAAEDLKFVGGL